MDTHELNNVRVPHSTEVQTLLTKFLLYARFLLLFDILLASMTNQNVVESLGNALCTTVDSNQEHCPKTATVREHIVLDRVNVGQQVLIQLIFVLNHAENFEKKDDT